MGHTSTMIRHLTLAVRTRKYDDGHTGSTVIAQAPGGEEFELVPEQLTEYEAIEVFARRVRDLSS